MERLVFGLEYRNTAGEEIELLYILNQDEVYYIEGVRVVPSYKPGATAYGYSGNAAGEYQVTVNVRKAPFGKYDVANDNQPHRMGLKVNFLAVCSFLARHFGARVNSGANGTKLLSIKRENSE